MEGGDDGVPISGQILGQLPKGAAFEFFRVGKHLLDVSLEFRDQRCSFLGFVGFEAKYQVLQLKAGGEVGIAVIFGVCIAPVVVALNSLSNAFCLLAIEFFATDGHKLFAVDVQGHGSCIATDGGAEFLEDAGKRIVPQFVDLSFKLGELLGDRFNLLWGEGDDGAFGGGGGRLRGR